MGFFLEIFRLGLRNLRLHKLRSTLTSLGIILGVASLVGMAAIIKGMENGMKESMIAMGGDLKMFMDLHAFIVIFGGATAATMIRFPFSSLMHGFPMGMKFAMTMRRFSARELIDEAWAGTSIHAFNSASRVMGAINEHHGAGLPVGEVRGHEVPGHLLLSVIR